MLFYSKSAEPFLKSQFQFYGQGSCLLQLFLHFLVITPIVSNRIQLFHFTVWFMFPGHYMPPSMKSFFKMVFNSFWTAHPAQSNVSWLYSNWEIGPSWIFKTGPWSCDFELVYSTRMPCLGPITARSRVLEKKVTTERRNKVRYDT